MKDKTLREELEEKFNQEAVPAAELAAEAEPSAEEKLEAAHHWIDDIFSKEQIRLEKDGITDPEVWVKALAYFDSALENHPQETLRYLAQAYNVNLAAAPDNRVLAEISSRLQQIEQNLAFLQQVLVIKEQKAEQQAFANFADARDDEGNLLHPYFEQVKNEMLFLLNGNAAADFDKAYEQALWMNPQTRAVMIAKQSAQQVRELAEEAERAKEAGFAPEGKLSRDDFKNLSTREILERQFNALGD